MNEATATKKIVLPAEGNINPPPKSCALLVLGMHRSGTSAFARMFNLLGADIPKKLIPPAEDNITGFWESEELCHIHNDLLKSAGFIWHDLSPVPESWFRSQAPVQNKHRLLEYLYRDFEKSRLFILKDPRISRLVPLWRDVLREFGAEPHVIIPIRNPLEVASSLEKRNNFTPVKSYLLWLSYMLDSERYTRELPRSFVTYDALLWDWQAVANGIADNFKISWSRLSHRTKVEIDRFLSKDLRHHRYTQHDLKSRRDVPEWVSHAYAVLQDMAENGDRTNLRDQLDQILDMFNRADQAYGRLLAEQALLLEERFQELLRLTTDLNNLQAVLERTSVELDNLQHQHKRRNGELALVNFERHLADRAVQALKNSKSWKLTAPLRFADSSLQHMARFVYWTLTGQLKIRQGEKKLAKMISSSELFDPVFYLQRNPDVLRSGFEPLEHFIQHGCAEYRDPNPDFDIRYYLSTYRDVAASGMNPLQHYLLFGRKEGRRTKEQDKSYQSWIALYDNLSETDRTQYREAIAGFKRRPLISVILPVYNTAERWLVEAIESVRAQLYPHWELCIADDASTEPHIRPLLERYANQDKRIRVVFRENNGHISAASNSALELARGEYIALLDHDDTLAETALYRMAEAINQQPDAGLIYSDEDKIDESGVRRDPYFKCDWNPDLFLSHNMICHLSVYRRDLIEAVGGFREGYEGSQDYDLALRTIEQLRSEQIVHVPYVLYHWRAIAGSAALAGTEKDYALDSAVRAINDALKRRQVKARAMPSPLVPETVRVQYQLPDPPPLVSLIIPTRDRLSLLRTCIESIVKKTDYPHYEFVIVDNGSEKKETLDYLEALPTRYPSIPIRIIRDDGAFNYSRLNNLAVKQAEGELIGLINNDIEVITPGWLTEMVSHACRPEIGAVGARLLYTDGRLQHAGIIIGMGGVAGHFMKFLPGEQAGYFGRTKLIQNFTAVTAACVILRKSIYVDVGGLDEENLTIAFNDVDLCLKITSLGKLNLFTPFAELYHHESASRGFDYVDIKKAERARSEINYMESKWGTKKYIDFAYNANLSLESDSHLLLEFPPRTNG